MAAQPHRATGPWTGPGLDLFFKRWGWKEKLKYVEGTGDAALTFVAYEILATDGFPVIEDGNVVCLPELKRCLTTKQWTVQQGTPAEICQASHLYALMMTHEFHGLAPMRAFFAALAEDLRVPPGIEHKIDDDSLEKFSLYRHGEIIDFVTCAQEMSEVQAAPLKESAGAARLANLTGCSWTPSGWANEPEPAQAFRIWGISFYFVYLYFLFMFPFIFFIIPFFLGICNIHNIPDT